MSWSTYETDTFAPAPLGEIPDLYSEERARSSQAAAIPHDTPETVPQLAPIFNGLVGFARDFQTKLGVQPISIDPQLIHILEEEDMGYVAHLLADAPMDTGGLHDPRTGISYIREVKHPDDDIGLSLFFYTTAHELGHKLTPGVSGSQSQPEGSFILCEGIADKFARDYMHGAFFPVHAPAVADSIARKFKGGYVPFPYLGLDLRPEEILMVNPPTQSGVGFSRIVETRIVETVEALLGAEKFTELMRQASSDNQWGSRAIIIDHLGIEIWDLISTDPEVKPPIQILDELQSITTK